MPLKVVWWALRYLGVDELIVSVIKAMYEDATTKVKVNGRESEAFNVRAGVHQGSVLSLLLFVIGLHCILPFPYSPISVFAYSHPHHHHLF